jgi:hypothetical protein
MILFKGVVKKAILQDLNDYKATVEQKGSIGIERQQGAAS